MRTEALSLGVETKKSLSQGSQTWLLTQFMLRDSAAINPSRPPDNAAVLSVLNLFVCFKDRQAVPFHCLPHEVFTL